ncbi:glycosyltransferase family 4 protein [Flavobacteriaceae bacterium]|nr:glycosyltransferase family 4 protein [Flavobacteriaceae bacterium]
MISQKKNILLLHSSNDLYGASKIFLQLIELLTKNGFDVHVILSSKGPLDKMISQIKGTHVSYCSLGVLRKKYLNPLGLINRAVANIKAIAFLSNYIKDHSIDLVYTNTSTILSGGIAAKKNGIPSLFHIHEIPTGNKLYEFFSGKIINRISDKVLTVSESVKKHWLKYIDDKKIARIYNGIIFSKTNSLVKPKRDQDDFVIISVARIIPYKGHSYLIDIADELIKKSTKFKFLIVGDTLPSYVSYEKSVKQKVKDLGLENQIKFLGFREDVSSILKQSDLFIHPAIAPDPLPTVLFESLHNDLLSVATNLGGAIEILDNGNNGLLIPYNDPKKAADLINEYCANTKLQKKHLENSKKNFKINFSSESFNKNILKEVNNLL